MGKRKYLREIETSAAVDDVFFLRDVRRRTSRSGARFLALTLSDRSGSVDARIWERQDAEPMPWLAPDIFVRVSGVMSGYRNRPQLNIRSIEPADPAALNQDDFVPRSYRDIDELAGFIEYFVSEVFDPDYSRLLLSFFGDEGFMERFRRSPGDAGSHHAYLGGLIEHTVSVATMCQHVTVQHPRIDGDLLVTAALLHDIGKVEELSSDGHIHFSREGQLLGHVLIGKRLVGDRIEELGDFPPQKRLSLLHAMISHHGELEWGAPKLPRSAEALVLHHIDNLDAKVKGFLEVVEGSGEVGWLELQNLFRRPLDEPLAADQSSSVSDLSI